MALAAPGPVVLTSNKADAWAATAQLRAQDTAGRVWTFDPQRIARAEQTWTWDPIAELDGVEAAERLASHCVPQTSRGMAKSTSDGTRNPLADIVFSACQKRPGEWWQTAS